MQSSVAHPLHCLARGRYSLRHPGPLSPPQPTEAHEKAAPSYCLSNDSQGCGGTAIPPQLLNIRASLTQFSNCGFRVTGSSSPTFFTLSCTLSFALTCACGQLCHIRCKNCPFCGLPFELVGQNSTQPSRAESPKATSETNERLLLKVSLHNNICCSYPQVWCVDSPAPCIVVTSLTMP